MDVQPSLSFLGGGGNKEMVGSTLKVLLATSCRTQADYIRCGSKGSPGVSWRPALGFSANWYRRLAPESLTQIFLLTCQYLSSKHFQWPIGPSRYPHHYQELRIQGIDRDQDLSIYRDVGHLPGESLILPAATSFLRQVAPEGNVRW